MRNTKVILFGLFLIGWATNTLSQDLIVTNEGDSLNCKITKQNKDFTYFTFKRNEEVRNTLLAPTQIKEFKYNFFKVADVPADKVKIPDNFPHLRLAIGGGYSYRTASISSQVPSMLQDYSSGLMSGGNWRAEGAYFFFETMGAGLTYNRFKSSNELNNVSATFTDGTTRSGTMRDEIIITYFGPTFTTRYFDSRNKNCFIMGVGLGYLGYTDNGYFGHPITVTGSTLGMNVDFGYDIKLDKHFAVGIQLSYLMGTLNQVVVSEQGKTETRKLDKNNYESLSHLNLTIGLRYNK